MNKVVIVCVSIIIISIVTAFSTVNSYAAWSAFKRITPENINEQRFNFTLSKIKFTEHFQLTLNDRYVDNSKQGELSIGKSAWLIITALPLKQTEQNIGQLLNNKLSSSNSKVLLTSKLGYSLDNTNKNVLEAELHKSQLNNAYIYVGYSPEVNDGGLRYTIDVKSFYKHYLIDNPKG